MSHLLPQEANLELPRILGRELQEVARAEKPTAGGLDGWAWIEVKALPLGWPSFWRWLKPQGLLDANIAMIPRLTVTPLLQDTQHNTTQHNTTPHHTTPHTTPHHTTPHHTTPHHTTPHHTTHTTHHTRTKHHNTPQHTTTHHNTPQHTTTHHNTPQHTTTHHDGRQT